MTDAPAGLRCRPLQPVIVVVIEHGTPLVDVVLDELTGADCVWMHLELHLHQLLWWLHPQMSGLRQPKWTNCLCCTGHGALCRLHGAMFIFLGVAVHFMRTSVHGWLLYFSQLCHPETRKHTAVHRTLDLQLKFAWINSCHRMVSRSQCLVAPQNPHNVRHLKDYKWRETVVYAAMFVHQGEDLNDIDSAISGEL